LWITYLTTSGTFDTFIPAFNCLAYPLECTHRNREIYVYFQDVVWGGQVDGGGSGPLKLDNFTQIENAPAAEWNERCPQIDGDAALDTMPL